MAMVDVAPAADLLATAAAQPHDPGFVPFVRRAQAAKIPVEIVSDGFGFFIEPALEALGVAELPVVTARTTFEGRRATIDFPNGHPTCLVCGTCKRNRVLAHQAAGSGGRVHRRRRERPLRRRLQRHRVGQALPRPDLHRGRLAVPALDRVPRDRGVAGGRGGRVARRSGVAPRPAPPTRSSAARRSGARASSIRRRPPRPSARSRPATDTST